MNQLVGEQMSIITHKPQTTRHRIMGIVNDEQHQIVFSDTPGWIKDPAYKMQEKMNGFISESFSDADIIIFVLDIEEVYEDDDPLIAGLKKTDVPVYVVINKTDLKKPEEVLAKIGAWSEKLPDAEFFPVSALKGSNTEHLLKKVKAALPEGPAYYPKDQLTDKSMRFFVSEIIREKILIQFKQEIPYSVQVIVNEYKEDEKKGLVRIYATIYTNRASQKNIIIGKQGSAIKRLGTYARKDIEKFIQKRVYLDLHIKVNENWRDDDKQLDNFGYQ